ncbi:hypothetical protein [Bradyrhizobium sp. CSS354]|nr:hypothetical protein [Bradyrhizobium sp. CSS354]
MQQSNVTRRLAEIEHHMGVALF